MNQTFEIKMDESQAAALIGAISEASTKITATLVLGDGRTIKKTVHSADELEDAEEGHLMLFLMRDGQKYQGYLKSVEEDDNMFLIRAVNSRCTIGLYLSGLFGWIDMDEPIKEDKQ